MGTLLGRDERKPMSVDIAQKFERVVYDIVGSYPS